MAIYFYGDFYDIKWEDVKDKVEGNPDSIDFLIYNLENGWDVNNLYNGKNQLHEAARMMEFRRAKVLLHYGIDNKAIYDGDSIMDIVIEKYMMPTSQGRSLQYVLKESIEDGYENAEVTYYCYIKNKDVVKKHPKRSTYKNFKVLAEERSLLEYPSYDFEVNYKKLESVKETVNNIRSFIEEKLEDLITLDQNKKRFNFNVINEDKHKKYEFLLDAVELGAVEEVKLLIKTLTQKNLVIYDRPYNVFALNAGIKLAGLDKEGFEILSNYICTFDKSIVGILFSKNDLVKEIIKNNLNKEGIELLVKLWRRVNMIDIYYVLGDIIGKEGKLYDVFSSKVIESFGEHGQSILEWDYLNKFDN